MKIVHALGWYFPDALGGTEVYVQGLARAQAAAGHDVTVMAPRDGDQEDRYRHEGIDVLRYPVPEPRTAAMQRGQEPHASFTAFSRMLAVLSPEVFHLHSLTYGCNLHHLRVARARGARAFVTTHVPGFVCMRGTMMRMGQSPCDGRVTAAHCTPCVMEARGLPQMLAEPLGAALARLPDAPDVLPGRLGTALGLPAQVRAHGSNLHALAREADRVIAVCEWLRCALEANGLPAAKLDLIRQGVDRDEVALDARRAHSPSPANGLRIGFFGRSSPIKGLAMLVEVLRAVAPDLRVELDAYVQSNPGAESEELSRVRALAAGNQRVRLHPPLAPSQVQRAMAELDVVAIPSLWLETGPLVALEALSIGVPVLGSDLGGLRELIEPGVTGWLEPAGDHARWIARIEAVARGGAALHRASSRVQVQSVREVAERISGLYERALDERG